MNLVLEKTDQVPYFTNMRWMLQALEISASEYDWYVSDIEMNQSSAAFTTENRWLCGETLQEFLESNEVQFIWAVFSAVPKGLRFAVERPPQADGNAHYWSGSEISPQLNGAVFEIACWDSSATLLIHMPAKAALAFLKTYPDARPLGAPS